ncbi:flavin reductase family protein [Nocardioides alkalitolerans]|uniref:flavin reductase family protein n=1 Tax=Nocardioides alkalitolerans TaxID=281714 RepID=UPI0004180DCE|nr:flavin reductase family protein [Nocardioides alkalitolerans]
MTTAPLRDGDARAFRDVMSKFASGITIISGVDETGPIGFTCQSFSSVSADPMLVSFSVMKTSTTYPRIRKAGRFAVNVLASEQAEVSAQFARRGTDKWSSIQWHPAESGNPVIAGSLMWVDCAIWTEYDAGDHSIVIGEVVELCPSDWRSGEPLLYFEGRYRSLRELDQSA